MNNNYILWLMDMVQCPEGYTKLMDYLEKRPFSWTNKGDANRAGDGLSLRARWVEEYGNEYDMMKPCSVLEMMVALACRIEQDIMFDPALGDRTHEWFWTMIVNLGLDGMDDEHYDIENVGNIVDIFLERRYFMNGSGGLFPLKRPKHNQRRVEIWYQMSEFLVENFG